MCKIFKEPGGNLKMYSGWAQHSWAKWLVQAVVESRHFTKLSRAGFLVNFGSTDVKHFTHESPELGLQDLAPPVFLQVLVLQGFVSEFSFASLPPKNGAAVLRRCAVVFWTAVRKDSYFTQGLVVLVPDLSALSIEMSNGARPKSRITTL